MSRGNNPRVPSADVTPQRGSPSRAEPEFSTPMAEQFTTPPMVHSSPSPTPSAPTPQSSTPVALTPPSNTHDASRSNEKKPIGFSLLGNNPMGDRSDVLNFKARCLSLGKMNVGVGGPDNWNLVDQAVKDDIHDQLCKHFSFPDRSKNKVLSRVAEGLRTYRRNLRKKHFPKEAASSDILALKEKVPPNVEMPVDQWNKFLENEAKENKLVQREQNKKNRAQKTDIHRLGSKSYEDLKNEWESRTKDGPDAGKNPNRSNLFLHARRDKDNKFPLHLAKTLESIEAISSQSDSSPTDDFDLENDALTKTFGKDKRGRTRGVGSHMPKTKLQHIAPLVDELSSVKNCISSQKEHQLKTDGDVHEIKNSLGLLTNQIGKLVNLFESYRPPMPPQGYPYPTPTQGFTHPSPPTFPSQMPHPPITGLGSSSTTHGDYGEEYYIKDMSNSRFVGVCILISRVPGTLVHHRPLEKGEAKIMVDEIYNGCGDVPVYVNSGDGMELRNYAKSFITWPLYLLAKI